MCEVYARAFLGDWFLGDLDHISWPSFKRSVIAGCGRVRAGPAGDRHHDRRAGPVDGARRVGRLPWLPSQRQAARPLLPGPLVLRSPRSIGQGLNLVWFFSPILFIETVGAGVAVTFSTLGPFRRRTAAAAAATSGRKFFMGSSGGDAGLGIGKNVQRYFRFRSRFCFRLRDGLALLD